MISKAMSPIVNFKELLSFLIVAMVATQGTYNKQNVIIESAFAAEKPGYTFRIDSIMFIPPSEDANNTVKLETTTSFADIPAMSDTTICQQPSPQGIKTGAMILPNIAAKLYCDSTMPIRLKLSKNHKITEAMKIVVPAFIR